MTTPWERGRPARTRPGTASPVSATSINPEWRHCSLFRPADAVPDDRIAACRIAMKLSGRQASKAAGCLQRRKPGWRGKVSPASQAHPGGEPCSRTPGAVGQGLVGEGGWQGQDAGGTPALPGDAVRLGGGRAPDGRIRKNLTCTRWAPDALSRRVSWSRIPISISVSERESNGGCRPVDPLAGPAQEGHADRNRTCRRRWTT